MRELFENSEKYIESVNMSYIRNSIHLMESKDRLIGIKGSRGVGKTTLFLQYIRKYLTGKKAIYITLDDIYFSENKLVDFVDAFVKNGGKYIFIDEVHHYKSWSKEIKLMYDRFPDLRIFFTGSSILHLGKNEGDLSRRAVIHHLNGLSFREYLNITNHCEYRQFSFEDILQNHVSLSKEIWTQIKPIEQFNNYLKIGYYPFFLDNQDSYPLKLRQVLNQVIEIDLPYVTEINITSVDKLKQLLYILSTTVPMKPNIEKLSQKMEISRNTLKTYIHYLHEAKIIHAIFSHKKGDSILTKPEKIYLYHPNMMYALQGDSVDKGTQRECFFCNQVQPICKIEYAESGDFMINQKYTIEVGGKNKKFEQIKNVRHSFIAMDDIESGYKNEIPLWLFGFLY